MLPASIPTSPNGSGQTLGTTRTSAARISASRLSDPTQPRNSVDIPARRAATLEFDPVWAIPGNDERQRAAKSVCGTRDSIDEVRPTLSD